MMLLNVDSCILYVLIDESRGNFIRNILLSKKIEIEKRDEKIKLKRLLRSAFKNILLNS